jgi:O-antigen ligase
VSTIGNPPANPPEPTPPTPAGAKVALAVLVGFVVLSPWPFGSVHLRTTQAIALVSLAIALGAFLWDGWHGRLQLPPRAILWPLLGLWLLAVFQLVPLPEGLHRALAPGSAAVWHPDVPAAAAVLGPGPHPVSLYPDATRRWLAFATGLVALALAAAPALRERRHLLKASTAVVSGAVLVALYAFVARLAFGSKIYGIWTVPTVAPFGPYVSKNHFAGYVELAALLAVGLATGLADEARHGPGTLSWIESRRAKWIVLAWGAAAVLVLAVPVSLSRGGVLSLTAGLATFVLLRLWSRRGSPLTTRRLALGLTGLALATTLLLAVLPSESRARILTLTGITTEQSGAYRLAIWKDTLRLAASSPWIGSGFGAYEDALPRFKTAAGQFRVQHAENDYLELLAEGGLVGTLVGGGVVLLLFRPPFQGPRFEGHLLDRTLRAGGLAALVAIWIHSAFDFSLRIPSNALMAALIGAFFLAPLASERTSSQPTRPYFPPLTAGFTLLLAIATAWNEPDRSTNVVERLRAPRTTSLRRSSLEAELTGLLRKRPARAEGWLQRAWLRLPHGEDARALAGWSRRLDPPNVALRRAAQALAAIR